MRSTVREKREEGDGDIGKVLAGWLSCVRIWKLLSVWERSLDCFEFEYIPVENETGQHIQKRTEKTTHL